MVLSSILIVTKNAGEYFETWLRAVYAQTGAGDFEVIIVDSGSGDETLDTARRYPARVECIPADTFHHARTRNYAASLARGDFLVFLTQDACPASQNWLRALTSNFSDSSVGAVYGRHLPKPGSTAEREAVLETIYGEQRVVKDPGRQGALGYRHYHFSDVNSAIRKEVWKTTGFPEELKVFEDLGIAKRILDSGFKIVYEPQAPVYHSHNHTALDLFKRYFDAGIIWRQLGIWNRQTRDSMLQDMGRLLRKKLGRSSNANGLNLQASVRDEIAKGVGMFLGLHERYLPLAIKRQMSAYRLFE